MVKNKTMALLVTLPNILWRISNFSEADKTCSNIVTFMGMKWKLQFFRHPDFSCNTGEKVQLVLNRLSPVADCAQAKDLKFSVATSIIINNSSPYFQQTSYSTPSYQDWFLWTLSVGEIKKSFPFFTSTSAVIFTISVSFFGTSQLKKFSGCIGECTKNLYFKKLSPCVESLVEDIKELYSSHEQSDFILKCNRRKFPVHRLILAARSDYFAAMFRSGMKETNEGSAEIKDIEPDILEQALNYMYSGSLSVISLETLRKIYAAADRFGIESLKTKCCSLFIDISSQDSPEDIIEKKEVDTDRTVLDVNLDKDKPLKELFLSREWGALQQKYPELAFEMCKPLLNKY